MSLLSYFVPQDLFRTSSSYNRDIRVQSFMGKRLLMVNGSQQSGAYVANLWRESLSAFGIAQETGVKNILVLGIGGGTVIHILHNLFPGARMTGVDIDPIIINLGKKYFGLGDIQGLTLKKANAQEFVRKRTHLYDLVVIDLFVGRHIPVFVSTDAFMRDVKKLLTKSGLVVINYLQEREYGARSDAFAKTLKKQFSVRAFSLWRNRFFCLKNA